MFASSEQRSLRKRATEKVKSYRSNYAILLFVCVHRSGLLRAELYSVRVPFPDGHIVFLATKNAKSARNAFRLVTYWLPA